MIRAPGEAKSLLGDTHIGLILDGAHIDIDESDACQALRECGHRLGRDHISDSNRGGAGSGHLDFVA